MSALVLVTGTLFRTPEARTSSNGKRFTRGTIKVSSRDESASEFWTVLSFSETASAELMRLSEGESLSVQGKLKLEIYNPTNGGEPRINRTVFVDHVLPLRAAPKQRKPKAPAPKRDSDFGTSGLKPINIMPEAEPEGRWVSDEIPF